MSLPTKRLGSTEQAPHTLEVQRFLGAASNLLLYIEGLPGVKVLAKKSWALTDDFEAYFSYKGRLWVIETPFSLIEVALLGQPPDERLFQEVESRVRQYPWYRSFLTPFAIVRYWLVRFTPSRHTFASFGVPHPSDHSANAP